MFVWLSVCSSVCLTIQVIRFSNLTQKPFYQGTGTFTQVLHVAHEGALCFSVTWVEGQEAVSWQGAGRGVFIACDDSSSL